MGLLSFFGAENLIYPYPTPLKTKDFPLGTEYARMYVGGKMPNLVKLTDYKEIEPRVTKRLMDYWKSIKGLLQARTPHDLN